MTSFCCDEEARQSFHDKAVLAGCLALLRKCQCALDNAIRSQDNAYFFNTWHSLAPQLRAGLQTAARIARLRPYNYLQAADETPNGSIAADASTVIIEALPRTLSSGDVLSDLVELILLEIAVANGTPRGRFGSFDGLRELLLCPFQTVVAQVCCSILRFCDNCDIFTAQSMAVKYMCDCCKTFINDTRFTSLDGDHTFDLCPACYELGTQYLKAKKRRDDSKVIIKGKSVGENPKLTCGEVRSMEAVAIQKEDTGNRTRQRTGKDAESSSNTPSKNLKDGGEVAHGQQLFNDFMDGLLTGISGLLGDELEKQSDACDSLMWLAVDLIRHSFQCGRKVDRAKRLAKAMVLGLSSRLEPAIGVVVSHDDGYGPYCILEGLISLFAPDKIAREYILGVLENKCTVAEMDGELTKSDTIVCTHGLPAKRRKCTLSVGKERVFFACPKKDSNKCTFFVWADQECVRGNTISPIVSVFNDEIARFLWELFTVLKRNEISLHQQLRSFIENHAIRLLPRQKEKVSLIAKPIETLAIDFEEDFADGVMCSRGRLQADTPDDIWMDLSRMSKKSDLPVAAAYRSRLQAEKALELVSLIATPDTDEKSEWFPMLCRIMLTDDVQLQERGNLLHVFAKRILHLLCSDKPGLSRAVHDHFLFCFHFEKLIDCSKEILAYCVLLNEKARCCPQRQSNVDVQFTKLSICDLSGTEDLISEDVNSIRSNDALRKILSELWTAAQKHKNSWRHFCGLRALPANAFRQELAVLEDFYSTQPLKAIFAVVCSSAPENQVKALQLINLALTCSNEGDSAHSYIRARAILVARKMRVADLASRHRLLRILLRKIVLRVSVDDIYAFVIRFVCRGSTSEIRGLASSVAIETMPLLKYIIT